MLCYWSFLVCFWRCLGIFLKLCWICSFIFSWYFYYTCWNLIPSWTCKPDESYVQRHSYHRYHRHADISCSHHRFSNRVEKRRALHSVLYLSILCVCLVFNIIHSLRSESSKRLHGFLSRLRKYIHASQPNPLRFTTFHHYIPMLWTGSLFFCLCFSIRIVSHLPTPCVSCILSFDHFCLH